MKSRQLLHIEFRMQFSGMGFCTKVFQLTRVTRITVTLTTLQCCKLIEKTIMCAQDD